MNGFVKIATSVPPKEQKLTISLGMRIMSTFGVKQQSFVYLLWIDYMVLVLSRVCYVFTINALSKWELYLNSDRQQFSNIQKKTRHRSPEIIEYKTKHDKWRWKSSSWLRTDTKMWRTSTGQWHHNHRPIDNLISNGNVYIYKQLKKALHRSPSTHKNHISEKGMTT